MSSIPGPTLGPCTAWIDAEDLPCLAGLGSDLALADTAAVEASMALFELSGRQFTGLCEMTVRPAADACGCWSAAAGLGPWYWLGASSWGGWGGTGWGWRNECGDRLGCSPLSRIPLAGYPVRQVLEVKIDGSALPEFDPVSGARNWRLDQWRTLTRMDEPGPPVSPRSWPGCQNLALDDDQPGTFSISYHYGVDPPPLGRSAAAELACQFLAAFVGDKCKLPAGVTRVTRQGITVERGLLANWFDPQKPVGLVHVDAFLAAYWSRRKGRRPAVWSPDVRQYGMRVIPD